MALDTARAVALIVRSTALDIVKDNALDQDYVSGLHGPRKAVDPEALRHFIINAIAEAVDSPTLSDAVEDASRITATARKWALRMMRACDLENRPFVTMDSLENYVRRAIEETTGETRQTEPKQIEGEKS